MIKPVRKAVLPVAGRGTRSLPATKVVPKELMTVVDKPVIQYAVEEARAAGIELFIFVSSRGKSLMEDHFDYQVELYQVLSSRNKMKELEAARAAELPEGSFSFVRQAMPLGLGHAIWCARHLVGDEPFAILLPDEIFLSEVPVLRQMMDLYQTLGGNIVAVREVQRQFTRLYGILDVAQDDGRIAAVRSLVEKPAPEAAPSTLSIVGRYIVQPEIFGELEKQNPGLGGEIQLTDGMAGLIGRQPFHGMRFEGRRFDCGDKTGFVTANVAYALARADLAASVRSAVERVLEEADRSA